MQTDRNLGLLLTLSLIFSLNLVQI